MLLYYILLDSEFWEKTPPHPGEHFTAETHELSFTTRCLWIQLIPGIQWMAPFVGNLFTLEREYTSPKSLSWLPGGFFNTLSPTYKCSHNYIFILGLVAGLSCKL